MFSLPSTHFNVPPTPFGGHAHGRVVSQPGMRVKQKTTFTCPRRGHVDFDDPSRFITSMSDVRLHQTLEYAPNGHLDSASGIVLHEPINRPLSPSNHGRGHGRKPSSSPSPPISHAGMPASLTTTTQHSQPVPNSHAIPINKHSSAEVDTPTSFDSHFSNFTAAFATPSTTSPLPTSGDPLRTSPSRWLSTLARSGSGSGSREAARRNEISRAQSARPASTDPHDARTNTAAARMGHRRKTSLQDQVFTMASSGARPPSYPVVQVQIPSAEGPHMQSGWSPLHFLSPQAQAERSSISPFGSPPPPPPPYGGLKAAVHHIGPPPGMPPWVHLPISDAFRPSLQRSDSSATAIPDSRFSWDAASVSASASASATDVEVLEDEEEEEEEVTPVETKSHHHFGWRRSISPLTVRNDGASSSGPCASAGLEQGFPPRPTGLCVAQVGDAEEETVTRAMGGLVGHPDLAKQDACEEVTSPCLDPTSSLSPRVRGLGGCGDGGSSTSVDIFLGGPRLRSFIDSPILRSRCGTPVLGASTSQQADATTGHDASSASTEFSSAELQARLELAQRCMGALAKPLLTVDEPKMEAMLSLPKRPALGRCTTTTATAADSDTGALAGSSAAAIKAGHETITTTTTTPPPQASLRPPLRIVRPKAVRSSASPSPSTPLAPKSMRVPSPMVDTRDVTPLVQSSAVSGDGSGKSAIVSRARKKSLVERRRESSGAALELPVLELPGTSKGKSTSKGPASSSSSRVNAMASAAHSR